MPRICLQDGHRGHWVLPGRQADQGGGLITWEKDNYCSKLNDKAHLS